MQGYDHELVYRPGTSNANANVLRTPTKRNGGTSSVRTCVELAREEYTCKIDAILQAKM